MSKQETDSSEIKFLKSIFIFERFSIAFSKNTEINKTQLQLQSRLCWNLFNKYLDLFLRKGFIQCRKDGRVENYSLTESGIKFFNILNVFLGCIK
ncbi:MAG: winged helix-turn-helix domain-containing protein [Candidatus Nitrosotenuis sp.]